jgi:nucleotide-binding universal stress UspA family protein
MRILVATDGSLRSFSVLPHAESFAAATGSELVLLRVLDPDRDVERRRGVAAHRLTAAVANHWKEEMDAALDSFGVSAQTVVDVMRKKERVHDAILRVADETGARMIALTSRGSGALRHALLGSVAMGVVGCSGLPVFTAGPNLGGVARRRRYRILATTDGSTTSRRVLQAVAPFLSGPNITVALMRVYMATVADRGDRIEMAECRDDVEALKQTLAPGVVSKVIVSRLAALHTIHGEIVSRAISLKANAIAMSTHGHSAQHHLLAGSTALGVLARAPVPVIFARAAAAGECR